MMQDFKSKTLYDYTECGLMWKKWKKLEVIMACVKEKKINIFRIFLILKWYNVF